MRLQFTVRRAPCVCDGRAGSRTGGSLVTDTMSDGGATSTRGTDTERGRGPIGIGERDIGERDIGKRRSGEHAKRSAGPVARHVAATAALGAIALGALVTALPVASAQAAPYSYYYYYGNQPYGYQRYPSYQPYRTYRDPRAYEQPREQPVRRKRASRPKAEPKPEKVVSRPTKGPLTVVVSIGDQKVRVFDETGKLAESPISSGTKKHPTPMGVFSVIQKHRQHYSNLYDNAPMPYMQRITWSGSALHQGHLPGYPASHGCVRMPRSFAAELWGMTKLGTRVIVARDDVKPEPFSHPTLDLLNKADPAVPVADDASTPTRTASAARPVSDAPDPAVPASEGAAPEKVGLQPSANDLSASEATAPASPAKAGDTQAATPAAASAPLVEFGPPRPYKPGPVSIFVSKKEGKLFVRKGFEPIYETPIEIADPEKPLGTQVFTATSFRDDQKSVLKWSVLSLPVDSTKATKSHKGRKAAETVADASPAPTPKEVLDRVTLPPTALAFLRPLMSPGASLIVSDKGLGPQTGKGTDFIVLTR